MSNTHCRGCGAERHHEIRCVRCNGTYCSEKCLRSHYWRHHSMSAVKFALFLVVTSAVGAAFVYFAVRH